MRVCRPYQLAVFCIGCLVLYFGFTYVYTTRYARWSRHITDSTSRSSRLALDVDLDRDVCHFFSDGSLKLTKKLPIQGEEKIKKHVTLAELNGQPVVVKTAPQFGVRVQDIFENKHVTVDDRWIKEETIDALVWPEVERVNEFSRQTFESMKRRSDRTNDHLFDRNEMETFVNDVVALINKMPSQEVWYHLQLSHSLFVPKYFGKCNRSHIVERLQNGDVRHFVKETLDNKRVNKTIFKIWRNVVLSLIHIPHQLDKTEMGGFYFCDAQTRNFGLDSNWEVKIIDLDSLFLKERVELATNQSCSDEHAHCRLQHCQSHCDVKAQKCHPIRTDQNFWALCEMVFDSGKLIKDRIEMKEHLTQQKFDYLQKLVNMCSMSKHDVTHMVHEIKALFENIHV